MNGIRRFLERLLRYSVRTYEWARGIRHYPWSSSPPQRVLSMIANRARGLPGANFRAIYVFAEAILKFRERLFLDQVNFWAKVKAPVDAAALRSTAVWAHSILATPPASPRGHINLRVYDADRAQLDRVFSVLLLSESLGSISVFFDGATALAARSSISTLAEENRGDSSSAFDINATGPLLARDLAGGRWDKLFSAHTGFDAGVNNYLKVAHPGSQVIALSLPEDEDGFCDAALPSWLAALDKFEASPASVSFVFLNAVSPAALSAALRTGRRQASFARAAGLSFPETLRLGQLADAFVGQIDVYGVAALTSQRPGIYLGSEIKDVHTAQVIQIADLDPVAALAQLEQVLARTAERPRPALAPIPVRAAQERAAEAGAPRGGANQYTLVIPTYDRPQLLARLLRCLERQGAVFPIVVLDSSRREAREQNATSIASSHLNVRHAMFDQNVEPYTKIREGLNDVSTPFCSICADDDVLFVEAVGKCVAQLQRHPDAAVAHGYYFNFIEKDALELSYVMYRSPSIDDSDALSRLRRLFAAYEAVFYGVFRTSAMQRAFRDVHKINTVLGKELVTAAQAAICGKVLRVPCFYYGRNTAESLPYSAWHPHQILACEPPLLFAQFAEFRAQLLECLQEAEPSLPHVNAAKSIDLIFLRYLGQFLQHTTLDFILDQSMQGQPSEEIYRRTWDRFVRIPRVARPAEPLLDAQGRYAPAKLGSGRPRDYDTTARTQDGRERKYRVHYDFIFPQMQPTPLVDRDAMATLLQTLDAY